MIENKEIKKRKYEISFVLKTENISVISQSLTNGGFVILTENPLEKVQLAYPIKKKITLILGIVILKANQRPLRIYGLI